MEHHTSSVDLCDPQSEGSSGVSCETKPGRTLQTLLLCTAWFTPLALALACGSDDAGSSESESSGSSASASSGTESSGAESSGAETSGAESSGTGESDTDGGTSGGTTTNCDAAATNLEEVVCAAEAFLGSLSSDERSAANLAYTDSVARTKWSNLPGKERPGVQIGALSAESQAKALAMMSAVLSDAGRSDLDGVRAADDYLASLGGMGGMGGAYGADNYYVAVLGTPSVTEDFVVMFGGHHMAFNMTYVGGLGYPIPNHLGVEPKAEFTSDGESYAPMAGEGEAMLAVFASLDSGALADAYLAGQTFSDVLIGPLEYGTGSVDAALAKYPTGSNRTGVLVSSLTSDQQALVTAAIEEWVDDADPAVADALMAAYTSAEAYADTYVAWGGTESSGVDPDVNGTYMRIDGPRLWIEVSCQNGVVVQGKTHYHSIYRDKQFDYGATL
ncbi:MAG: DUF3500 domain-containing protein [Nannocystaceae bacterium]